VSGFPEVPVLAGAVVRLEHLSFDHVVDLAGAAEEERSSYRFIWVPTAAEVDDYVRAQLDRVATGMMVA
jgi:hypothetical protein